MSICGGSNGPQTFEKLCFHRQNERKNHEQTITAAAGLVRANYLQSVTVCRLLCANRLLVPHPCWTLYRNSLRTERRKWLGRPRDTLSLMKASTTACRESVCFYPVFPTETSFCPNHNSCVTIVLKCLESVRSDLVVVRPDQGVDLVVGCRLGVGGVTVSRQSSAGVPVSSQALLIQVDVNGGVQLAQRRT